VRSLIEPLRKIIARLRGHFVAGKAVDISMHERLVEVEATGMDGKSEHFFIPYVISTLYMAAECKWRSLQLR
jgi:hypothetical protein